MEDAVSGRAQQLYSSTVSTVVQGVATTTPKMAVPSVVKRGWKSSRTAAEKDISPQQAQPLTDPSRFLKRMPAPAQAANEEATKIAEGSIADKPAKPVVRMNPYGFTFQKQADPQASAGGPTAAASNTRSAASTTSPGIDWDRVVSGQRHTTRFLMRANGGASLPQPSALHKNENDARLVSTAAATATTVQQGSTISARQDVSPSARAFAQRSSTQQQESAQPQQQQQRPPPPRRSYPDEDEELSLAAKLGKFLPPIPRLSSLNMLNPFRRRNSIDYANLDAWNLEEEASVAARPRRGLLGLFGKKANKDDEDLKVPRSIAAVAQPSKIFTEPMADLMERCREGKTASLLNRGEKKSCRTIGRQRAALDLLFLTFVIAGIRQLPSFDGLHMPQSVVEALTNSITEAFSFLAASTETWAPFALAGAFLAIKTRSLVCDKKAYVLAENVESSILEETQYGSLFLRIVSSMVVDRSIPQKMQSATRAQIASKVDIARLHSFVVLVLASFLLTSVSLLQPLFVEWVRAIGRFITMEQWRTWPPQGRAIVGELSSVVNPVWSTATSMIGNEFANIAESPMRFVCKLSIFAALAAVAFLPALEAKRRSPVKLGDDEIDEDEDERNMHVRFTEQVENLGSSGATRLDMLAVDGRVDRVLERWRMMMPRTLEARSDAGFHSVFRLVFYGIVSSVTLFAPLLFCRRLDIPTIGSANSLLPRWDYMFDVAAVMLFTQLLVWKALLRTIAAEDVKEKIAGFVTSLASAVEERRKLMDAPPPALSMHASVSPTAGIAVKDLWASHTTKRAWAIRGANLSCQNGEVLVLLGDDGAGKTRLITTLAESIISPPRKTLSTQGVRGSISVGGLEVAKWDHNLLKRRLGLSLSDVRSVSDTAQILSGLSLEEILDPCDGLRNLDPSHNPGPSEKSAIMLALKLTGLYSTLLRRLPSKLSTVVSASEEDLHPSPLRPRYHVLSPSEWSKLLLARVLAQAIYDNENSAGTNDSVANSLVGSVLLLDDLTLHLSEVEEGRILRDLRATGAATIMTSNRWATGRFADKIAVLKDGAIVECGTHTELLNRGPQQSIYAAKWNAMTSNA